MAPDTPATVEDLLVQFEERSRLDGALPRSSQKLSFAGVGDRDVYNITAPFHAGGEAVIAGRVEARDSEAAEAVFFIERGGRWEPRPGAPVLSRLQDPCVTTIGGELVVGGVEYPVDLGDGRASWRMVFHRGSALEDLEPFLVGPNHMKDIRLAELDDGRVGVFSRPQGERGGRGTIGFTMVSDLGELSAEMIDAAPLLEGQFREDEWGGANEAHLLADGSLGVLGHIARMDAEGKHYYPMAFALEPDAARWTPPRIIATRSSFPEGPPKRPDLVDVVFSGGLARHGDGTATLYAGISDTEAAWTLLPDPF